MPAQKKQSKRAQKAPEGSFFVVTKVAFVAGLVIAGMLFLQQEMAYAQGMTSRSGQSFFSQLALWLTGSVNGALDWVEDQGSKAARAIVGDTSSITTGTVLGETLDEAGEEPLPEPTEAEQVPLPAQKPFTVPRSAFGIAYTGQEAREIIARPGTEQVLSATYTNAGQASWEQGAVSLNILTDDLAGLFFHDSWETRRRPAAVSGVVLPGALYRFTFLIRTPVTPGIYQFAARPVAFAGKSFGWLGAPDAAASWIIRVAAAAAESAPAVPDADFEQEETEQTTPAEESADVSAIDSAEPSSDEPVLENKDQTDNAVAPEKELVPDAPAPYTGPPAALLTLMPDVTAPETSVHELSANTAVENFEVLWSGTDAFGIDTYDIQYQVDSGDWIDWLTETVLLTSTFTATADGTHGFRSRARDYADNVEGYPATADASTVVDTSPDHSVVINEIAWAGTAASADDQWIELYNTTAALVDLTGWTITNADSSFSVTLSGTIATSSYFLLERDDDDSVSDVAANQIFNTAFSATGDRLYLRKSNSSYADKAGSSSVVWFAGDNGTKATMERKDPSADGTASGNWASNDTSYTNGKDSAAADLNATAGSLNSVNTTIPRAITNLQPQWIYVTSTTTKMYWTAPQTANLATTTTATYDVRYLSGGGCSITESNWASATQVTGEPTPPVTAGTAQTLLISGLTASTHYCFGIKTHNGANESALSNILEVDTKSGSYTVLGGYPVSNKIASSSSPYIITGDLTITAGQTFIIEPGTVIKMAGNYSIVASNDNTSVVIGDVNDPINGVVITSKDDDRYGDAISQAEATSDGSPSPGDWGSMLITNGNGLASANVDNAIIAYGGNTSHIVNGSNGNTIAIDTSIIEYSNTFGAAIISDLTSLTVASSTFRYNFDGIGVSVQANLSVTASTFTGHRRAITIDSNADPANISITNNNIYGNNRVAGPDLTAGLQYGDTDIADKLTSVSGNWWGDALGPTEDIHNSGDDRDGIIDNNDSSLTQVTYGPISTAIRSILPSGL